MTGRTSFVCYATLITITVLSLVHHFLNVGSSNIADTAAAATTQHARTTPSASSTANSSPAHSRPATATSHTSANNNNNNLHSSSMHTSSSSSVVLAPNATVTHSHSAHSSSHSSGEQARLALFAAANAELAAAGTAASYRDPQHRQRRIDLSTKPSAWIQQQPLLQQQLGECYYYAQFVAV
jgi:hypothetical protein